jgi:glycine/D-amino acid oxidase-like deaminating enzyme
MGGIRQQFCTPVTVQMVRFSVALWKVFDAELGSPERRPRAWFRQRGYLFLADEGSADRVRARYELERRAGAAAQLIGPDEIRSIAPDLMLDDIVFGLIGPEDGYANPREVLAGFQRAAVHAGVEYRTGEVVSIDRDADRVSGVRLAGGDRLHAPIIVNAAGPWAGALGRLAGVDVPVEPMRQMLFRCALPHHWPYRFPMIVDPGGVHWRHDDPVGADDQDAIIAAFTNWNETPGERFEPDAARWAADFHPAMARRLPALKDVREVRGWAGLYEMTPDHNPVLGEHPALKGFIFANGFSGHGLMMSPATGKIVSEMVILGRSETFDIGIFAPDRFARGALIHDAATI